MSLRCSVRAVVDLLLTVTLVTARGATTAHYAVENNRKRITVLHKANVCKLGDGLWLRETQAVMKRVLAELGAADKVRVDDQLADSFLCDAVRKPAGYDILLCPNLIGDFVSDMAGGLAGSLGLCGSANLGDGYGLFEPAHGSAPDIAGKQLANPTSMVSVFCCCLRVPCR